MLFYTIKSFFRHEAAGGILLLIAAVLAMLAENSFAESYYSRFLSIPVEVRFGTFQIQKPLLLWINDGLMAIFFFLIGLEIKREFISGELSEPSRIVLPVIAAVGGMAVPALIYAAINWENPITIKGWAIPSATDIAFALGVLGLLGSRVPRALKLFLMTLAIVDDLGAIVIIALFYTSDLSVYSLWVAGGALIALFLMNRFGVLSMSAYILVTLVLWSAVLKSGVHATLAGVLAAFFIPYKKRMGESQTQLEQLEHDLQPAVAFVILPLFAFANTGISFASVNIDSFLHTVPLGIAAGLFFGNQIGVFGLSFLAIKLKLAELPKGSSWLQLYGVALLCGIGFTMSLFISSLAFSEGSRMVDDRIGILAGSTLSAVLGFAVLYWASRKNAAATH